MWEYGADLQSMQTLAEYWRDEFDWRSAERELNEFDNYLTEIDGQSLHFIHQKSTDPSAVLLLILHGWPGSEAEFTNTICPLVDPCSDGTADQIAFHVAAPSLPGYGFSGPTSDAGWDTQRMASAFLELMSRLGYERFAIQGGDFGSITARWMARKNPERVSALLLSFLVVLPPSADAMQELSAEEIDAFTNFQRVEMGYFTLQQTKPQTISYSLNDSPIGLLASHAEKFQPWVGHDGSFLDVASQDAFLTNLTIYWVTQISGSSARLYREGLLAGGNFSQPQRVETPIGHAVSPEEVIASPERWNDVFYNVVRRTEMPVGGHFAALEQPIALVGDIRAYFAELIVRGEMQ
jgi:epoxide hydrolase